MQSPDPEREALSQASPWQGFGGATKKCCELGRSGTQDDNLTAILITEQPSWRTDEVAAVRLGCGAPRGPERKGQPSTRCTTSPRPHWLARDTVVTDQRIAELSSDRRAL